MKTQILVLILSCVICWKGFAATAVETHGFLKVSGNRIVDANNSPVQLKGMSFFWSQWMGKYWNADCVRWLQQDWKCSVVRAAMGVESGGYLSDPATNKAHVKRVVDAAIARGIYVIIDWHDHNAQDHLAQSKAFFAEMAQTYGKYPNVIYEIYNEPDNESWATVKNYATQVIAEIRKYDSKNLVIVGTPTWSQDVDVAALSPIAGSNIAYTLHFYAATHKSSLRNKASTALSRGIALFVTECGTSEASGSGFFDGNESTTWFNFLDQNKISWCNWSVADKQETSAALQPNASSTGGWPTSMLTTSGNYIRNKLRSYNSPYTDPGTSPVNQLPSVTLTSPAYGSSFTAPASIVLSANASDADGTISKVEFYRGTTLLNSDASAPYSYTWTNVATGTYSITARAYDNTGATRTSTVASITVTTSPVNQLPSVTLTSPANGSSFTAPASIVLSANANDADGSISKVEFYQGTTLLNSDASAPFSYSWTNVSAGTYSITARAYDNAGATRTSAVSAVTVTNGSTPVSGINAPSCLTPGNLYTISVNPEAGATASSWWANADVTIAKDPVDFKKATIKVNSATGTFTLNCGVNFSGSPYYKEYTKTISIGSCATRQLEATISPYPAEQTATISTNNGSRIVEIHLLNSNGQVVYSQMETGSTEVQFAPGVHSGMYILQMVTDEGVVNQPYLKVE